MKCFQQDGVRSHMGGGVSVSDVKFLLGGSFLPWEIWHDHLVHLTSLSLITFCGVT